MAEVGEASPDHLEALVRLTDRLGPQLRSATSDVRSFGPAKRLAMAMEAEGVEIDDSEAVQRWISEFNARPFDERAAVLPDEAFPGLPPAPPPAS